MAFENTLGLAPEVRREADGYFDANDLARTADRVRLTALEGFETLLSGALSGDMVIVLTPATTGSSAADVTAAIAGAEAKYTRTVVVELQNAAGTVHTWFDGTLTVADGEVTNGDGTAATTTPVTLVNGVGSIDVDYIGAWAAADTQTVTVSGTLLGYTLAAKTSVDTLIA